MSASLVGSEMCIRDSSGEPSESLRRASGEPPESTLRAFGELPESLRRASGEPLESVLSASGELLEASGEFSESWSMGCSGNVRVWSECRRRGAVAVAVAERSGRCFSVGFILGVQVPGTC
eukprot:12645858-Alexandrium_andersonii.AAC.1